MKRLVWASNPRLQYSCIRYHCITEPFELILSYSDLITNDLLKRQRDQISLNTSCRTEIVNKMTICAMNNSLIFKTHFTIRSSWLCVIVFKRTPYRQVGKVFFIAYLKLKCQLYTNKNSGTIGSLIADYDLFQTTLYGQYFNVQFVVHIYVYT